MKYIRTTAGIYKIYEFEGQKVVEWNGEKVISQADTIEELCDGFVFKDTCANKLHLVDQNDGISMLGVALFEETLRGFIETDEGLIYVAKMNQEGELELI